MDSTEKSRLWRKRNPKRAKQLAKEWKLKNPERAKEIAHRAYLKRKSKVLEYNRQRRKSGLSDRTAEGKRYRAKHQEQVSKYQREWHLINAERLKPVRRDYYKRITQARYIALRKQCIEYLGGQCKNCGLRHECVAIYDFHHKNPSEKDFDICKVGCRNITFDQIKKEIDKCDLLCCNCHRILHKVITPSRKSYIRIRQQRINEAKMGRLPGWKV